MKRVLLAVTTVFLLAALVRLPGLGRSLWYDELFTVRHFTDSLQHALFAQRHANNHPLASVLALLARCFSDDPRVLRAPFVLLGALSVLATGWLAQITLPRAAGEGRGGGSLPAAGVAALLAALHPAHVAYSQEVRGYAALLLLAPLVTGLALSKRRPVLLAVTVALGLLAHLSLFVLVVALAAFLAHERAHRTLAALAVGSLAALAAYAPTLSHLGALAAREPSGPDGLSRTLALFATDDGRLLTPWLGAPLFALAALGALRAPRLAAVVWAAFLIFLVGVACFHPVFHARFALSLLPLVLALAGHGATVLARGRKAVLVAAPFALVLAVATARRARWETEPVGPALAAYPGARFVFTGLGAELYASDPAPTHEVRLYADSDAAFQGLEANVDVRPLPASETPATK